MAEQFLFPNQYFEYIKLEAEQYCRLSVKNWLLVSVFRQLNIIVVF